MTADHDLDVPQPKAELLNILPNTRHRFLICCIQKNMPFRSRGQVGGEMQRSSHKGNIADNAEGLARSVR